MVANPRRLYPLKTQTLYCTCYGLATVTLDEMGLEPRQDHYKWELLGKETIKRGKLEWGKNVTNHTDTPLI